MKINLVKIITISLVIIGVIFWGLNYLSENGRKSKATGETINLTFNPTSVSNAAVNQDFTVKIVAKPSINALLRGYETKVNFDKTKLAFKSIEYLVGSVSSGLGNINSDATAINSVGQIKVIGESQSATGYSLTLATGADLVSLTFTVLNNSPTSVTFSNSSFYSINADMSLFNGWTFTQDGLSINGGAVVTLTPNPTSTPVPTLTPQPTDTTGNVNLKMKLRFQGINKLPAAGQSSMVVKAKIYKEGESTPIEGNGTFISDDKGVWSGTISANFTSVTGRYRILVKGNHHIQKRICDSVPTETSSGIYRCAIGNITLAVGDNNLDFSGILLLAGDLDQSGIVDSVDFALIRNNLGKTDSATLVKADINRDGKIDTQDFSLIIFALGVRTDEL